MIMMVMTVMVMMMITMSDDDDADGFGDGDDAVSGHGKPMGRPAAVHVAHSKGSNICTQAPEATHASQSAHAHIQH